MTSATDVAREAARHTDGRFGEQPLADPGDIDLGFDMCPVCGEPADHCQGHGEIGDPAGYAIAVAHDDGDHSMCVGDCHTEPDVVEEFRTAAPRTVASRRSQLWAARKFLGNLEPGQQLRVTVDGRTNRYVVEEPLSASEPGGFGAPDSRRVKLRIDEGERQYRLDVSPAQLADGFGPSRLALLG